MSTMDTTYLQDIAQAASAELANSSITELRGLSVEGTNAGLQLTGRVRSFYHKQLAQETVRTVAAGMQVVNNIVVCT